MTDVEWETFIVRATAPGSVTHHEFYKAWKTGHLGLVGYGATLNDAIAALLNKHGE